MVRKKERSQLQRAVNVLYAHLFLQQPFEVGAVNPILQMRKLRRRERMLLAQDHTAGRPRSSMGMETYSLVGGREPLPCYLTLRSGSPQVPSSVLQSGSDRRWGSGHETPFMPLVSRNSFHIPEFLS